MRETWGCRRRPPAAFAVPALLAVLALTATLGACGKPAPGPAQPVSRPTAIASQTPAPSASAVPPPSEPPPPLGSTLDCSGGGSIARPPATGTGPLGTMRITGSEKVALTFDDGPDPVNTPKILDLLRQCGVKATFCVNGIKVAASPSVIRRIHTDGHSFCNHTWRHIRQLGTYGPEAIRLDLSDTNNAIRAIVPDARISYFRAPSGAWTQDYITVARELGMTALHWDIDTRDWESSAWGKGQRMVDHIVAEVQGHTKPGSIILFHDYQKPDTTAALRILLPWLKPRFSLAALPPAAG